MSILPFLELSAGVVFALLLFRAGMPSIFPLLIWIPLLSFSSGWVIVIGLISASLAWEARAIYVSSDLVPFDWLIGFGVAVVGVVILALFSFPLSILASFIVPLLLLSLGWLIIRSTQPFIPLIGGLVLVLLIGWLGLHVWVVPLALPALLLGFFGAVEHENGSPLAGAGNSPFREAGLGVLSGLLPGIGPGIMGALWFSGYSSPSLRVSNLVFSLGLVSLTGAVRSFPAGILSSSTLPSWEWILAYTLVGFLLAFGASFLLPPLGEVPLVFFFIFHSFFLFLFGGIATLLLILLSFFVSRLLLLFHLPLSLCSLCLLPSILWFYY